MHPTGKAQTLEWVAPQISLFKVPEFIYFSVNRWNREHQALVDEIVARFSGRALIVRSSAAEEDSQESTSAGKYESVTGVSSSDRNAIRRSIKKVTESYDSGDSDANEIIVQELVNDSIMSGVIFSHDLATGAPYYVINYDDISGLTNSVTSGQGQYSNRTIYIHRGATRKLRSDRFQRLLRAVQEVEHIFGSAFLDIEFAMGEDLGLHLLQVRAMTTPPNSDRSAARKIDRTLRGVQSFVRARFRPKEGVYGVTSVLGQMPDWNPAEMIGRVPKALAFSLYKELITDDAWRVARERMDYAVPSGQPLMVSLAGQPFIDVRLSFHSFLPATLAPSISEKLVNSWVEQLSNHPELHDKIEFEVAITAYDFSMAETMNARAARALDEREQSELQNAFRHQLIGLLNDTHAGSVASAMGLIESLAIFQGTAVDITRSQDIGDLFHMIERCIRLGTVPFAILARHAFIARTLLLSLQNKGILSSNDISSIQSGIRTVAGDLVSDIHRRASGRISHHQLMEKYGHLRPNTYDLLSPRYDQVDGSIFMQSSTIRDADYPSISITADQRRAINDLLVTSELPWNSVDDLITYIQSSTAGREYAKFVFSRSVSDILELIANFGKNNGVSREQLSHVPLQSLLDLTTTSEVSSPAHHLSTIAKVNSAKHALSSAIHLPQVLFDEAGVHIVPFQVNRPNFITSKTVTASALHLQPGQFSPSDLAGSIVLIENADPGFDWIFAQPIAGLITQFGGANSHMAIRCAEFGLPAAIGCGEQRFKSLRKANRIILDCSAHIVSVVH